MADIHSLVVDIGKKAREASGRLAVASSQQKKDALIFSADAEPTLVNRKIKGTREVPKTNTIKHLDSVNYFTKIIAEDLNQIGINQNFAPVIDASPNKVVSNRSFGLDMDTVINFSKAFISVTQNHQVAATAKHFPGHGFVVGDTHKKLVYIDGEMKEVKNYVPMIEHGVTSIMVAHLAIKNNPDFETHDMPSTLILWKKWIIL